MSKSVGNLSSNSIGTGEGDLGIKLQITPTSVRPGAKAVGEDGICLERLDREEGWAFLDHGRKVINVWLQAQGV